jgi:N-acylneuraminate cytidylyltransferase
LDRLVMPVSHQTNPQVLALIPARGGSKSIPQKNIKPLGGIPLLAYSILAGQEAQSVERVIVSTDDPQIAEVARRWGAEVPFLRPAELARDDSTDISAFEHALTWLDEKEGYRPDLVVQLRPTSPLRPPDCVDAAVELLHADPQADSVRGVVTSGQNPYKMWRFNADGSMRPLLVSEFEEPYNMPRQLLPPTYWQTGHIDVIRRRVILEQLSMTGERIIPLVIDPLYMIDIDSERDWYQAEWMLERLTLPYIRPEPFSPFPADLKMLVMDFDGVLTDNRVWVTQDGVEAVACYRGDGMGLSRLRRQGIGLFVISKEKNPVVGARCAKLRVDYQQGVDDKVPVLDKVLADHGFLWDQIVYIGNDVNDLACIQRAGCGVAVADAHPAVLAEADLVLEQRGGHGAVRELCDLIMTQLTVENDQ